MRLKVKKLRKSINKSYLKEPIDRSSFNNFTSAFTEFLNEVELAEKRDESEEHFKNFIPPFFEKTGFSDYFINTNGRIDLAIHTDNKAKASVGVLIEIKRPSNQGEMISENSINRKAMHEAVLYYLEQRSDAQNSDLRHVVISNMWDWYIFDAQEFEYSFYQSKSLLKTYKSWKANQKVSSNKDFMYNEISRFMESDNTEIEGLHIDLRKMRRFLKGEEGSDYEKKLIPLYKIFTPSYLLKEPFANDSNSLNREFYRELLYILGLEEMKEKNTRYIRRASTDLRQTGSLVENTITILDAEDHLSTVSDPVVKYGGDRNEQLFHVALDLCITWMNRILFLKLLEAQLFRYHRGDKKFKFLNYTDIDDFDELNKLFFQVLAKRESDRSAEVNEKFGHIPYLNSSLFDVAQLERETTRISGLDDKSEIPVYNRSVLTDKRGNSLNTLEYLFRFLDAYDFSADGGEEIREERKTLINASVLGLIFEKINGYKDGSFYTPGFITEYMARETLRKTVVDKLSLTLNPSPLGRGTNQTRSVPGEGEVRGMSGKPGEKLPEELIIAARDLRKRQTNAEEYLWQLLRNKQLNGFKFRRQHPVKEGFILDFYCHKARLGVELDGGYHEEKNQKIADARRTEFLNELGISIIRFKNEEVLDDTESVLQRIAQALTQSRINPEHPSPPGRGTNRTRSIPDEGLTLKDIYNHIGRDISIKKANEVINNITVCDPAVGSGHFLVSCLNELLAIKSYLGILCDTDGKVLRNVNIHVENDELITTYADDELYNYDVSHTWQGSHLKSRKIATERQRIQQTLFHEKRYLIENCLFGVDINPNSVKICRLRLWIELLKHAYYTQESDYLELEVLPNIDINIKLGNSLVSRFDLDSDLSDVFRNSKHSLNDYKEAVQNYKNTGNRTEKHRLQQLIDDIKKEYSTNLLNNRPINKKLSKERGRLDLMQNNDLFGDQKFSKKDLQKQKKKVQQLEKQKDEEESGVFFNQAFEWRFEFPEVLDQGGKFLGFDIVIGNPPYIRQEQLKDLKGFLKTHYSVFQGTADLYQYFIEQGMNLLRDRGLFHYIVSNKWMRARYGIPLREWLQKYQIESIIDFGDLPVFEEATTYPCLLQIRNENQSVNFNSLQIENLKFDDLNQLIADNSFEVDQNKLPKEGWTLIDESAQKLLEKVKNTGMPLHEYVGGKIYRGILTGLNEAFVIDRDTKEQLLNKDPQSIKFIKPFLAGKDIKRYQPPCEDKYLINIPSGWTNQNLNGEDNKWELFKKEYPAITKYLGYFEEKAQKRYDQGEYWWELRACSYLEEFEKPKIILPDISLRGNFTYDQNGEFYLVNTAYLIGKNDKYLLGILASNLV
ncbi:MAG TPA: DUF559 domain-containing protein, partial [Balneolales bacterium]|nr:DUF559 domain-containing protein [Balneolales bacterium]